MEETPLLATAPKTGLILALPDEMLKLPVKEFVTDIVGVVGRSGKAVDAVEL